MRLAAANETPRTDGKHERSSRSEKGNLRKTEKGNERKREKGREGEREKEKRRRREIPEAKRGGHVANSSCVSRPTKRRRPLESSTPEG